MEAGLNDGDYSLMGFRPLIFICVVCCLAIIGGIDVAERIYHLI